MGTTKDNKVIQQEVKFEQITKIGIYFISIFLLIALSFFGYKFFAHAKK